MILMEQPSDRTRDVATFRTRRGREVVVGRRLGAGGEGTVFETNIQSVVAKIYASGWRPEKRAKLEHMVVLGPPTMDSGVILCWPRGILFDEQGSFAGYLMTRATGVSLAEVVFQPEELLRRFPSCDRTHLVTLSLTILHAFARLHPHGVLVGDVSGANVVVEGPEQIWLIDTDSFQVGRYPSCVGTGQFVPPELHGADLSCIVRTIEHELFSAATQDRSAHARSYVRCR